jgi:hypothetical protein
MSLPTAQRYKRFFFSTILPHKKNIFFGGKDFTAHGKASNF